MGTFWHHGHMPGQLWPNQELLCVLGECWAGKINSRACSFEFLPHNTAILPVPAYARHGKSGAFLASISTAVGPQEFSKWLDGTMPSWGVSGMRAHYCCSPRCRYPDFDKLLEYSRWVTKTWFSCACRLINDKFYLDKGGLKVGFTSRTFGLIWSKVWNCVV